MRTQKDINGVPTYVPNKDICDIATLRAERIYSTKYRVKMNFDRSTDHFRRRNNFRFEACTKYLLYTYKRLDIPSNASTCTMEEGSSSLGKRKDREDEGSKTDSKLHGYETIYHILSP